MAAHILYTHPVTDYFTAIPMKYEQKILETIHWGVIEGKPMEDVRPKCLLPGIPPIPDVVFEEMFAVQVECCNGFK